MENSLFTSFATFIEFLPPQSKYEVEMILKMIWIDLAFDSRPHAGSLPKVGEWEFTFRAAGAYVQGWKEACSIWVAGLFQ